MLGLFFFAHFPKTLADVAFPNIVAGLFRHSKQHHYQSKSNRHCISHIKKVLGENSLKIIGGV